MKAAIRLLALAVLLLPGTPAPAQVELPPAAREVLDVLEHESADIEKKLEDDLKKRQERTAAALKEVQDQLCRQDRLDEAADVRDLLRSVQSGNHDARTAASADPSAGDLLRAAWAALLGDAGSGLPAAARDIRRRHDREVAGLYAEAEAKVQKHRDRAIAELEKVKQQYCKDAKLDEALAVRDLIRQARAGGPAVNVAADPGYVNNAAQDIGKVLYYDVTGAAAGGSIYGTDVFTTGSHLAMAAVHSGVLRAGQRGVVKVTILPGQQNYPSTTRNGITSTAYGAYGVSFKVERAYGLAVRVSSGALPDPGTVGGLRDSVGKSFLFEVTGSNTGSVWGSGSSRTSVCMR